MSSNKNSDYQSRELKTAIKAAKIGAAKAKKYFDNKTDLNQKTKLDNTPVTIADPATEEVIKKFILSKFPNANIIGEETGGSMTNETFWVIDPIDGTRSFIRGIPTWGVLIAFCKNNQFQIGVCYFPLLDVMIWAETGQGAFLNGKKINVSKVKNLNKAYVSTGNIKHFEKKQVIFDLADASYVLRCPEATYATYLVVCGKTDALVDVKASLWDYAPFITIAKEAGGKISNTKGDPLKLTDKGYVVTNGLLHDDVIKIVNKY
ncbi:MAG TPA: inositol monophosphatase [Candidatus Limnocylindrales bacterium]|nr:inositol monophosphatase [Candidatus Limnocylindrales bacterium]